MDWDSRSQNRSWILLRKKTTRSISSLVDGVERERNGHRKNYLAYIAFEATDAISLNPSDMKLKGGNYGRARSDELIVQFCWRQYWVWNAVRTLPLCRARHPLPVAATWAFQGRRAHVSLGHRVEEGSNLSSRWQEKSKNDRAVPASLHSPCHWGEDMRFELPKKFVWWTGSCWQFTGGSRKIVLKVNIRRPKIYDAYISYSQELPQSMNGLGWCCPVSNAIQRTNFIKTLPLPFFQTLENRFEEDA